MTHSGTSNNDAISCKALAVHEINGQFQWWDFTRRSLSSNDVLIRILYCGICHGDIHTVKNEWQNSKYPLVPGHEIVGIVDQVGDQVTKVKQNDHVGVGFFVDSCRRCDSCKNDLEQHCIEGCAGTFNGTEMDRKTTTYGGFSNFLVVDEHYVLKIPPNLSLDRVAPLLCAGITIYSALRQHNVSKDTRLGVVGFGGVGHLAVKYGVAMGAEVTVISTTESKRDDAMKLGAKEFLLSTDPAHRIQFDLILDCAPANHDLNPLLNMLKFGGIFCMIGAPPVPLAIPAFSLIQKRLIITGSFIGGIKETQEMLDFSDQHNITCDVELITASPTSLATAFDRTINSDVRYRFVIDIEKTFNQCSL